MKLNEIIIELNKLGAVLVGSRLIGCASLLSDYDYLLFDGGEWDITDYIYPKLQALANMGFTQVIGSPDEDEDYYYLEGITTFYRLYSDCGQKVEVQFTNSSALADVIYKTFYTLKFNETFKTLLKPFRKFYFLMKLDEFIRNHDTLDDNIKSLSAKTVRDVQFVVFEQLRKNFPSNTNELLSKVTF